MKRFRLGFVLRMVNAALKDTYGVPQPSYKSWTLSGSSNLQKVTFYAHMQGKEYELGTMIFNDRVINKDNISDLALLTTNYMQLQWCNYQALSAAEIKIMRQIADGQLSEVDFDLDGIENLLRSDLVQIVEKSNTGYPYALIFTVKGKEAYDYLLHSVIIKNLD